MHMVNIDTLAYAGTRVTGEVKVRHGIGYEGIIISYQVHKGSCILGGYFFSLDSCDYLSDHFFRRHLEKELGHSQSQALGIDLGKIKEIVYELDLDSRVGHCLAGFLNVVNYFDTVVSQCVGKLIVLFLSYLQIRNVIKEKSLDSRRGKRFKFQPGSVQENLDRKSVV